MSFRTMWTGARKPRSPRVRLTVEMLEDRVVPYTTTGNSWPAPQLITISFVPDGTILGSNGSGYIYSNMFATWNGKFGSASVWENQILKAAQVWAQQTNINFAVVADNGAAIGQGNYQQGDPNMGDIRIGGYNFGTSTLASADFPPPANNYSLAGDIQFNTGQSFNIGATYDLFTVAAHEFGHALGLGHSTNSLAVMYSTYQSAKSGLYSDDTSGIRAIYSNGNPRTPDAYYGSSTPNNSFANAANITSLINPVTNTAVVNSLDITTTSETEYYTFTAPAGSANSMTITLQSSGLSLLDPKLTVYAADQSTVLGTATGSGEQGNTLTVTVSGISPGQQFYIKVGGAVTTSFGTGVYALTLNLGTGSAPTVPLPNTQLLNGNPIQGGGGLPDSAPGVETPGRTDVFPDGGEAPANAAATPPAASAGSTAVAVPSAAVAPSLQAPRQQASAPVRPPAGVLALPASAVDAVFGGPRTVSGVPSAALAAGSGPISANVPALPPGAAGTTPASGGGGDAVQSDAGAPPDQPAAASGAPDASTPAVAGPAAPEAQYAGAPRTGRTDSSRMTALVAGDALAEHGWENPQGTLDSATVAAALAAIFSWGARPADREEQRGRAAA